MAPFIVLAALLCLSPVNSQFQLSFGTQTPPPPSTPRPTLPGGYDPACKDAISNCANYGSDACSGAYLDWAKQNCEATCGFCKPLPTQPPSCVDKLDSCDSYRTEACHKTEFVAWARENCRATCRFCTAAQLTMLDSMTTLPTTPPTLPPALCVDKVECRLYGQNVCTNSQYVGWAQTNCPLFCSFCKGVAAPPALCVDRNPDCAMYQGDLCTNPDFALFVDDNCQKFCNKCGVPTPPMPCVDSRPDCQNYPIEICSQPSYKIWAEDNCRKYCGFCGTGGPPTAQTSTAMRIPPTPKTPPHLQSTSPGQG